MLRKYQGIRAYGLKRKITKICWWNIESDDEERKLVRQFWTKVFPFFLLGIAAVGMGVGMVWLVAF